MKTCIQNWYKMWRQLLIFALISLDDIVIYSLLKTHKLPVAHLCTSLGNLSQKKRKMNGASRVSGRNVTVQFYSKLIYHR